jgi:hypothetical protein
LETEVLDRGESLSNNDVTDNVVTRSASSGISSISNNNGRIIDNTIDGAGVRADGTQANGPGNGIGVNANAAANKTTANVVFGNIVNNAFANGMNTVSDGNVVSHNRFTGPSVFGILNGGHSNSFTNNYAVGSQIFDLIDGTEYPTCDNDVWSANTYGTAAPACTTAGGFQVPPPPPAAVAAATAAVSTPPELQSQPYGRGGRRPGA